MQNRYHMPYHIVAGTNKRGTEAAFFFANRI